jgi:hypothetical protein
MWAEHARVTVGCAAHLCDDEAGSGEAAEHDAGDGRGWPRQMGGGGELRAARGTA